jgi:hypothetical protein
MLVITIGWDDILNELVLCVIENFVDIEIQRFENFCK